MTPLGNFNVAPTAVPFLPPVNPGSMCARLLMLFLPQRGGKGSWTKENLVVIRIVLAAYCRLLLSVVRGLLSVVRDSFPFSIVDLPSSIIDPIP